MRAMTKAKSSDCWGLPEKHDPRAPKQAPDAPGAAAAYPQSSRDPVEGLTLSQSTRVTVEEISHRLQLGERAVYKLL